MSLKQFRAVLSLIGALVLVAVAAGTLPAAAQETTPDAVQLSIKPVNSPDSYYTVTGEPGDVVQLEVELANHGTAPIEVRSYPADVYSLVNGGFGVALADEPTSGATHWLDYPAETFELDAETALRRTFALTIPQDATSGEYLAALVIQNATPVGGEGAGIGFQQVNRQAIAVAIEIPGARLPGIALGGIEHAFTAGRSVISAAVENTGNVHLTPEGEFVLVDGAGTEVLRKPVTMGSVYAGTATLLEVPFSDLLPAGEYLASLELADRSEQVSAKLRQVAITVPEMAAPPAPAIPEPAESGATSPLPQSADANAATAHDASEPVGSDDSPGIAPWLLVVGIAGALTLGAGATLGAVLLMRRRPNGGTPAPAPDRTSGPCPEPEDVTVLIAPEPATPVPSAPVETRQAAPLAPPPPAQAVVPARPVVTAASSRPGNARRSSSIRQLLTETEQARCDGTGRSSARQNHE